MHFRNLTLLSLIQALAFAHQLPRDVKDGLYSHAVNENGDVVATWIGDVAPHVESTIERRFAIGDHGTGETICQSDSVNTNDAVIALSGLASSCGNGNTFHGGSNHRGFSYRYGSITAYSCDYSGTQTCTSNIVFGYGAMVMLVCGGTDGYYQNSDDGWAYGITTATSFC